MKQILFLLFIFILFLIPVLAQENNAVVESVSIGKVKGVLFDSDAEVVYPNKKVIIEGIGIKRIIETDENGEYEFALPVGIYSITTEHYWLFPLSRASFIIHPDTTSIINLYPASRNLSIALEIAPSGLRDRVTSHAKQPKYDTYPISRNSSVSLHIQFSKKINRKEIIEYKNAILSYDNITIIAEEIQFDKNKMQIKAKGVKEQVLIDNNGQQSRKTNAFIEFRMGIPVLR